MPRGPLNIIELDRFKSIHNIINCPYCGSSYLNWEYFCTSKHTWNNLAGREGYEVRCSDCDKFIQNVMLSWS